MREGRLLDAAEAWPVVLSIGKPKAETMRDDTVKVRDHFQAWREVPLGQVEWETTRYRAMSEPVDYPARWILAHAAEWVQAGGSRHVAAEFNFLKDVLSTSDPLFHPLLVRRRSLWRGRPVEEVRRSLQLAVDLSPGCADGLPLRALPVAGNDSKFFERNERLLLALFDLRFDGEASRQGLEAFLGASSRRGHWLLVVDLDGSLLPYQQLRVRAVDLEEKALPASHLIVVENESCQHQLPSLADTVAVLGSGFDLGWLGAGWLREKTLAYWGDLDTWGLELLGRARARRPDLAALLTTVEVFDRHRDQAVEEPVAFEGRAHPKLTDREGELFELLKAKARGRLEQEFLTSPEVRAALEKWRYSER